MNEFNSTFRFEGLQIRAVFIFVSLASSLLLLAVPALGQFYIGNEVSSYYLLSARTAVLPNLPVEADQNRRGVDRPFVGAVNGKAFILRESFISTVVEVEPVNTSRPVFKSFGLTSDGQNLLYSPLKNSAPSGELIIENIKTGRKIVVTSRLIISAAISPVDNKVVAYTFASGEGFALAVADITTGDSRILVENNVYAETFEWNSDGSGIHYLGTSIPESTIVQEGIVYYESTPKSGELNLRNKYVPVGDSDSAQGIIRMRTPAGFPTLVESPGPDLEEKLPIRYGFRTSVADGKYELIGENFLGIASLIVSEKLTGKSRDLGEGQLIRVISSGLIVKKYLKNGTELVFVGWNGTTTSLGITMVSHNLPVDSSVMIQGGVGYSSPGNCSITAHSGSMEYAYDFQSQVVSKHVMASASGLVVYNTSYVTCNTIDTTSCPDYSASGCPGSFLGNVVIVQHADGSYSKYAHMETNSPQAVVGTTVDQGLYIGRQGHTGSTNGTFNGCGDHVHFQLQSSPDLLGQSFAVDFADVATEPLSCGTTYVSASTEISHSISPSSASFGIGGGAGNVNVTSTGGTWSAISNDPWLTITNGGSGNGNDVVSYSVADNSAGGQRAGSLTIGGHVFTVIQSGGGISNQPPSVGAGIDQTITLPQFANLTGFASDDGLPSPPSSLATTWSKVSGPGTVNFSNPTSLSTTVDFSIAGIYVLRLTGDDTDLTSSDDIEVIVNTANGGGMLAGSQVVPPSNVDLTTEGTTDWAHWGLNSSTSFDHKAGVVQEISDYTRIGTITPVRYTNNSIFYDWNDGTPTTVVSGTSTGIYIYQIGSGFQFSVPADTTYKTLKLYVGLWSAGGKLEASLSDGSASPYIDTSLISNGVRNGVYALDFKANSNGQTLIVKWTVDNEADAPGGNITLQAAALIDGAIVANNKTSFDFDGDRKTDISIFRPSLGQWWYLRSSDFGNRGFQFGNASDKPVPADFTGDGKTDIAFYRNGEWFILRSEDSSFYSVPFGTNGDIPAPGDFDGDGKADTAVYRPSNTFWYIQKSSGGTTFQQFGVSEDKPIVADYDGDGKDDIAVFRPSVSQWWLLRSNAGVIGYQFGSSGDKTVQGDYTGDGKADVAIWRPSNGFWYILRSEDASFYAVPFGNSTDVPTAGDYDGDGKFDTAVFRPSDNFWYVNGTTSGSFQIQFGIKGDIPLPSLFSGP